jgi:hypothetical protein
VIYETLRNDRTVQIEVIDVPSEVLERDHSRQCTLSSLDTDNAGQGNFGASS